MDPKPSIAPITKTPPPPPSKRMLSIAFLVIIILASVTTVLFGTLAVLSFKTSRNEMQDNLRKENARLAYQLSVGLSLPIWNFDREQIETVATSVLGENDVHGVIVRLSGDKPSTFVAERTKSGVRKSYGSEFTTKGLIADQHQIRQADDIVGSVEVYTSTRKMEESLRKTYLKTAIVILAIELTLILSLYLLLWRIVLKPLQEIERFATEVSISQLSPVPPSGYFLGELDRLRTSIERMIGMLNSRYNELKESELKYKDLFENIPIPILEEDCAFIKEAMTSLRVFGVNDFTEHLKTHPDLVEDFAGRVKIISANRAALELFGAKDKTDLINAVSKTFVGETYGTFQKELQALWESQSSLEFETVIKTLPGELRNVSIKWSIAPGHEGSLSRMLVSIIDITARKKAEEALRGSDRKIRAVFDTSFELMGIMTTDGTLIEVNRSALEFAGVTADKVVGKYFWDTPWWSHSQAMRMLLKNAVINASNGEMVRFEATHPGVDGTLHTFDFSLNPVKDDTGKVVLLIPEGRDITEIKSAAETLKAMAGEWQNTFDAVGDAIWLLDVDQRIMRANKATATIFGESSSVVQGRYCYDIVHGTSPLPSDCPASRVQKTLTRESMELRLGERWLEVVVDPILDRSGKLTGMVHIVSDITSRRHMENALRESERRLHEIIDFLPDATFAINTSGQVIAWNKAIEEMTGVKAQDILGKGDHEYSMPFYGERRPIMIDLVFHPDKEIEAKYAVITKAGNAFWMETEVPLNGSLKYLSAKSVPLYDSEGRIVGAIESIRDITENKQFENALRDSERRLYEIIDFLPDATFVIDANSKVIAWNRAIEEMTGIKAKDMLGRCDFEYAVPFYGKHRPMLVDMVLRPDKEIEGQYKDITKADGAFWTEAEIRINGKNMYLSAKSVPLYDNTGKIVGAIEAIRDISERKSFETALKESEQRLNEIIEFLPDAIMVIDANGVIIAWNRAIEEMTGVKAKDMIGKGNYEHSIPAYGERRPSMIDLVLHPDKETEGKYAKFTRVGDALWMETEAPFGGKARYISAKAVPLYNNKGEIAGAIESIRDITESKKFENALYESERRLNEIIEFLPDAIMVIDVDGKVIAWNRATELMTGVSAKDMLGKSDREYSLQSYGDQRPILIDLVLHPDPEAEAQYPRFSRNGDVLSMEGEVPFIRNRPQYISAKAVPLYNSEGEMVGAIETLRDITESKKAEEALRKSEERFRGIANNLPGIVYQFYARDDGRWGMYHVDARSEIICGVPTEPLETWYERILACIPLDSRFKMVASIAESVKESKKWEFETYFNCPDGRRMYLKGISQPRRGDGEMIFDGLLLDITERKLAEEEIQKLASVITNSGELVNLATIDGKMTFINKAGGRMLGIDQSEVEKHVISEIVYKDCLPLFNDHILPTIMETGSWNGELKYQNLKTGKALDVHTMAFTVNDPDTGKPLYLANVSIDITARKRAETELQHLKDYLSNIINSMPSILVGMNHEGIVSQWNLQAELATGKPAAKAIGHHIQELLPDFHPWIEALQSKIRHRHPATMERQLLVKNGDQRFYDIMAYPLITNGIEGAVIRIEDITEKARIQELIIQTEKMMSLGGLAAGMAHEINNPLGIINLAVQNIERRILPDLPANQKAAEEIGVDLERLHAYFAKREISHFVQTIKTASTRAARIVSNMLQFTRKGGAARQSIVLPDMLERVIEFAANDYDLRKKYDFRSVEIVREYDAGVPQIQAVVVELEQVFLNLVKNAAQAMGGNPPERKARMTIRAKREGSYAVVEIEDNGPGMTEDVRKRVFEPFFTTKEPGMGTGLGLSVSYMIITQNHKGLINVQSPPGGGALFIVKLPIAQTEKQS